MCLKSTNESGSITQRIKCFSPEGCGLFFDLIRQYKQDLSLRLVVLMQMVVRSPFLLGLSCETLAARMRALSAALPNADMQRMVESYPSLLEVIISMCCFNFTILTPCSLFTDMLSGTSNISWLPHALYNG